MTISFVVKLTCDVRVREYDPDSACGAICQGTFTLTRERKHELSAPEGWTIESMNPLGGPYHHDSRIDLEDIARAEDAELLRGDVYHVRCPKHAKD